MKKIIIILFFSIIYLFSSAQNDTIKWEKYWYIKTYISNPSRYFYEYQDTLGNIIIPKGKYHFLSSPDEQGYIIAEKKTFFEKIFKNNYGFIDINEKILIPFKFFQVDKFSCGLASVKKNDKYGFINRKGKIIIPIIYKSYARFYDDGVIVIQKQLNKKFENPDQLKVLKKLSIKLDGKFVLIDTLGNEIIEENNPFNEIKSNFPYDHVLWIQKEGKWAFFDLKGNPLTPFIFDKMHPTNLCNYQPMHWYGKDLRWFYKGLIVVQKGDQYAVLNEKMGFEIPWNTYQWISPLSQSGLMIVKQKNKFGLLNTQLIINQPIVFDTISYSPAREHEQNYNSFWGKKDGKYYIFDTLGIWKDSIEYDNIKLLRANFYLVTKNGLTWRLDRFGNKIMEDFNFIREDGWGFIAEQNSKYGYVSSDGEIIIPFDYEDIINESNGRIFVKKNGKWGIINKKNEQIMLCMYDYIAYAWDDSAKKGRNYIVVQNDKFGKVNEKGETIFPCIYDGITTWVENGPKGHHVMIGDKMGIIDYSGKIMIPIQYESVVSINGTKWAKTHINGKVGLCFKNDGSVFLPIEYDSLFVVNNYWFSDDPIRIVTFKNNIINILDEKGRIFKKNVSLKDLSSKYKIEIVNYFPFPCTYELFLMIHNRTFKIPGCILEDLKKNNYSIESIFYKM